MPIAPAQNVVPITLLRSSVSRAYRTMIETGEPLIVQRYGKKQVKLHQSYNGGH